jgi:hypothetical protein
MSSSGNFRPKLEDSRKPCGKRVEGRWIEQEIRHHDEWHEDQQSIDPVPNGGRYFPHPANINGFAWAVNADWKRAIRRIARRSAGPPRHLMSMPREHHVVESTVCAFSIPALARNANIALAYHAGAGAIVLGIDPKHRREIASAVFQVVSIYVDHQRDPISLARFFPHHVKRKPARQRTIKIVKVRAHVTLPMHATTTRSRSRTPPSCSSRRSCTPATTYRKPGRSLPRGRRAGRVAATCCARTFTCWIAGRLIALSTRPETAPRAMLAWWWRGASA